MSPSRNESDADRGFIIPIGGAEEKFDNPEILQRFVELCGGRSSRIAIIPTASRLEDTGERYLKLFNRLGAEHVRWPPARPGPLPSAVRWPGGAPRRTTRPSALAATTTAD